MKKLIKREDLQLENKADGVYGNAGKPSKHDLKTSQKHHRKHQKGLPCGMSDKKKYHIQYNVGDNIQMDSDGHRHGPVFADGGIGAAPSAGEGVGECGGDCGGGLGEGLENIMDIKQKLEKMIVTPALQDEYFDVAEKMNGYPAFAKLKRDLAKKYGANVREIDNAIIDETNAHGTSKTAILRGVLNWINEQQ